MSRKPNDLILSVLVIMTLFLPASIFGAGVSTLVFEFADDDSLVTLTDASGQKVRTIEGAVLTAGSRIATGATTAEFRLVPNGSLLKLARNTVFEVRALGEGAEPNAFALAVGRLRMVAAKVAGVTSAYQLTTPTAQAGVRGTDFALEANNQTGDWICVKEGAVEFSPQGNPGAAIVVRAGEFANVKMAVFAPKKATAEDLADKFEGLDFVRAKEAEVPGHEGS